MFYFQLLFWWHFCETNCRCMPWVLPLALLARASNYPFLREQGFCSILLLLGATVPHKRVTLHLLRILFDTAVQRWNTSKDWSRRSRFIFVFWVFGSPSLSASQHISTLCQVSFPEFHSHAELAGHDDRGAHVSLLGRFFRPGWWIWWRSAVLLWCLDRRNESCVWALTWIIRERERDSMLNAVFDRFLTILSRFSQQQLTLWMFFLTSRKSSLSSVSSSMSFWLWKSEAFQWGCPSTEFCVCTQWSRSYCVLQWSQ